MGEVSPLKWELLFLDLVIVGLQLLMLVTRYEKQVASDDAPADEEPQA